MDAKAIGDAVTAAMKPLQDELAAQGTKVADLSAKAFNNVQQPERKTLSAEVTTLLAKSGLKIEGENGKLSIRTLDDAITKSGLNRQESIALKIALQDAGRLEAA
jgi:uncharacterized protein YggE